MNSLTATAQRSLNLPERAPTAARTVFRLLQQLRHGSLTLQLPDGSVQTVGDGHGPHASVHLHNWKPFAAALKSGDIGFAESYIAGDWSTPQLAPLLGLLLANRKALDDVIVCLFQNGERIRPENGYPVRLLVPGYSGNMNIKWLRRIKLVNAPVMSKDETSKYTILLPTGKSWQFVFPLEVKSMITRPSPGSI